MIVLGRTHGNINVEQGHAICAIYEAGFDILLGYIRNNKTLMAQGMVNGATAFLPNLNLIGGQGQEPWMGQ